MRNCGRCMKSGLLFLNPSMWRWISLFDMLCESLRFRLIIRSSFHCLAALSEAFPLGVCFLLILSDMGCIVHCVWLRAGISDRGATIMWVSRYYQVFSIGFIDDICLDNILVVSPMIAVALLFYIVLI